MPNKTAGIAISIQKYIHKYFTDIDGYTTRSKRDPDCVELPRRTPWSSRSPRRLFRIAPRVSTTRRKKRRRRRRRELAPARKK